MRQIPLPELPKRAGLDGYILFHITQIIGISPEEKKIIFNDDEVDPDNWRKSLDTDGHNNISVARSNAYTHYDAKVKPHCIPTISEDVDLEIPEYIMSRFKKMREEDL